MEILGKKVKYRSCAIKGEGIAFATQSLGYLVLVKGEGGYLFTPDTITGKSLPNIQQYYGKRYRYIYKSNIKKVFNEAKNKFEKI